MDSSLLYNKKVIDKTILLSDIEYDIENIIIKINEKSEYYLDYDKIKIEFNIILKQIILNNSLEFKNKCIDCGIDMGKDNPRQLCGKIICLYK